MIRVGQKGLTLIELLIAIAIFGLIAAAAAALLSASLNANTQGDSRYGLYREGLMIMERMTGEVRRCTFLLIPNAHNDVRDILAFSGFVNEDNDFYFDDDPLFPRIDEDPKKQMTDDGKSGIEGVDDDGDGQVDESGQDDDDEDGLVDEDPLNPVIYSYDGGTSTLQVSDTYSDQTVVLSTRVSTFQVTWETPDRILITLTLTGDDGEGVTFSEYVHIENTYQRIGKRVK